MKIKKLTLKEAEKIITKLVDEDWAFSEARDADLARIDKLYPCRWDGKPNPDRDHAFEEHNRKFSPALDSPLWNELADMKLFHLTQQDTPIAENKQCCQNCVGEGFCTRRRYVSNSYYICDKYRPTSQSMFGLNLEETLIAACQPKTKRQEVGQYLDRYKKLLKFAAQCESEVVKEIKPLPEAAIKKADEWHAKLGKVHEESRDAWEPVEGSKIPLYRLRSEKVAKAYTDNGLCPMSAFFGPIVHDDEKVDR